MKTVTGIDAFQISQSHQFSQEPAELVDTISVSKFFLLLLLHNPRKHASSLTMSIPHAHFKIEGDKRSCTSGNQENLILYQQFTLLNFKMRVTGDLSFNEKFRIKILQMQPINRKITSRSVCFCSSCIKVIVLLKVAQMRLLVSFCSTAIGLKQTCKV